MRLLKYALLVGLMLAMNNVIAEEGYTTVSYAQCKVQCIQDAANMMPASLFSDVENTGFRQTAESYPASINVFILERNGAKYMIDAGNPQPKGILKRKLELANVAADSISCIYITHIHPDHVGGLVWNGRPLFKNATLYIAKLEYEAWRKDAKRRSLAQFLEPYKDRLRLFEYGAELPGGMLPIKMSGHTPGHTIFRFERDKGTYAYFVGDIVHGAALQIPHPSFCARYDMNPKEAVASRRAVFKLSNAVFFGAHHPFPGIWK